MRKTEMFSNIKKKHNDVLEKLLYQQSRLRILDFDFVCMLNISQSYFSRLKLNPYYVSITVLERLELATLFFDNFFSSNPQFHLGQQLAETITQYRKRKKNELQKLGSAFACFIKRNNKK